MRGAQSLGFGASSHFTGIFTEGNLRKHETLRIFQVQMG